MSTAAAPSVRHWQIVSPITGAAHEAYTLLGSEDTTIELALDTDYAVIMKVGNTGDMAANGDWQLQYEKNGAGGFFDVNASSSNLRSAASGDADNATSGTERLATSAETFVNSTLDEGDGLQLGNVAGSSEKELYFTFNTRSAELTAGSETLELRLTTGGATFDHAAVEPIDITFPALAADPLLEPPLLRSFAVTRATNY